MPGRGLSAARPAGRRARGSLDEFCQRVRGFDQEHLRRRRRRLAAGLRQIRVNGSSPTTDDARLPQSFFGCSRTTCRPRKVIVAGTSLCVSTANLTLARRESAPRIICGERRRPPAHRRSTRHCVSARAWNRARCAFATPARPRPRSACGRVRVRPARRRHRGPPRKSRASGRDYALTRNGSDPTVAGGGSAEPFRDAWRPSIVTRAIGARPAPRRPRWRRTRDSRANRKEPVNRRFPPRNLVARTRSTTPRSRKAPSSELVATPQP